MNPPFANVLQLPCDLPIPSGNDRLATSSLQLLHEVRMDLQMDHVVKSRSGKLTKCWNWMEREIESGAGLTLVVPREELDSRTSLCQRWLGERLCWWPLGLPKGRWSAVVSSRLGQRLDLRPEWFDLFRDACARIQSAQEVLLVGERTTTGRFAERAAAVFGMTALIAHSPRNRWTLSDWFQKLQQTDETHSPGLFHVFVSPPFRELPAADDTISQFPVIDRATIVWADQIFVPHLRRRGNLEPLLGNFLRRRTSLDPAVYLAIGARLVPPQIGAALQELGAVPWECLPQMSVTALAAGDSAKRQIDTPVAYAIPLGQSNVVTLKSFLADFPNQSWSYLTHCTRAPAGRWPDETEAEFLDELLLNLHPSPRSPLQALQRIVTQRLIRASSAALRGRISAVCFTEVPLPDIHGLRSYQPQRQCWDFEPYGLSIDRDWLVSRGARPVIYGDDANWQSLRESERPFFQFRETRRGRRRRDWSLQREWRHLGDVDLSTVPADAALLFVPNAAEGAQLAALSPWPIVVCGE